MMSLPRIGDKPKSIWTLLYTAVVKDVSCGQEFMQRDRV